jgi:hypothetical protein
MIRLPLLCTLLLLAVAAPAAAMVRLAVNPVPVAGDPADRLLSLPIEDSAHGKRGKLNRKVNETIAHRDHVHIGMTERGVAARTSFWSRGR